MSIIIRFSILFVLCVALLNAEDLIVGTSVNTQLGYSETVKLSSVPLKTRTKNVFWNSNSTAKLVKGVSAMDIDKSSAQAIITSGGIGYTYVNVRIKSSRGDGLNYLVQIFV